jgi:hypothetical protein
MRSVGDDKQRRIIALRGPLLFSQGESRKNFTRQSAPRALLCCRGRGASKNTHLRNPCADISIVARNCDVEMLKTQCAKRREL